MVGKSCKSVTRLSITDCAEIPVEYTSWGDAEAVVAMISSFVGLLSTYATCHIFIRHNDTPVVKASTRELSYLILAGMTISHIAVSGLALSSVHPSISPHFLNAPVNSTPPPLLNPLIRESPSL